MNGHTGGPLDAADKLPNHGLLNEVVNPNITLRQDIEKGFAGMEFNLLYLSLRLVEGFLTGPFSDVVNENRTGLTVPHRNRDIVAVVVPRDVTDDVIVNYFRPQTFPFDQGREIQRPRRSRILGRLQQIW